MRAFFELKNNAGVYKLGKLKAFLTNFGFLVCFLYLCGARIDNNRREYCVPRTAQLCVHACVLRIFFYLFFTESLILSTKIHNLPHLHKKLKRYITYPFVSFL